MLQKWNVFVEKAAPADSFVPVEMITRLPERITGKRYARVFPGARTGFNNQVPLFFERLFDRLRHLQLSAAEFVRGMGARQHSARRED